MFLYGMTQNILVNTPARVHVRVHTHFTACLITTDERLCGSQTAARVPSETHLVLAFQVLGLATRAPCVKSFFAQALEAMAQDIG